MLKKKIYCKKLFFYKVNLYSLDALYVKNGPPYNKAHACVYSPNPVLIQATSKTYLFGELNNNLVELIVYIIW